MICDHEWVGDLFSTQWTCSKCGEPFDIDLTDREPVTPVMMKLRPLCTECCKEMSETLDIYYGRDPFEAKKCKDCRK